MNENVYIVAAIRPWNILEFQNTISHHTGKWHLITDVNELTPAKIKKLNQGILYFLIGVILTRHQSWTWWDVSVFMILMCPSGVEAARSGI